MDGGHGARSVVEPRAGSGEPFRFEVSDDAVGTVLKEPLCGTAVCGARADWLYGKEWLCDECAWKLSEGGL
jgi:hypothetical protein